MLKLRHRAFMAGGLAASLVLGGCSPRETPEEIVPDPSADADGGVGDDPVSECGVVEGDENGVPDCEEKALPGSFAPDLQWSWTGRDGEFFSIVTPLVGNLTDDNGDGVVDLCDGPDILVVASATSGNRAQPGHIYILDGATGLETLRFETIVDGTVTPALGDIDGDGTMEVVTVAQDGSFIAFEHDGTVKWNQGVWGSRDAYSGAIALADIDHDGDVEIVAGNIVLDHEGNTLWQTIQPAGRWSATAVADLDGDQLMEIVLGHAAYHADGTLYYETTVAAGFPQIANLDEDPDPEVLVTNANGITLLEHDGTVKYTDLRPTGDPATTITTWLRPATIHDFDGDGLAEYALSSASHYTVYKSDGSMFWSTDVVDASGIAGSTAFDFLGDGVAEAMYADEFHMFIFGDAGEPLLEIPRTSGTLTEYPVVADVDNDGSAEIVVVSNQLGDNPGYSPTVQVIRDVDDRWIQARRIWNQHTYHVTNVREDGTIPQFEQPSWQRLNTYRTNAQIGVDGVCDPVVD